MHRRDSTRRTAESVGQRPVVTRFSYALLRIMGSISGPRFKQLLCDKEGLLEHLKCVYTICLAVALAERTEKQCCKYRIDIFAQPVDERISSHYTIRDSCLFEDDFTTRAKFGICPWKLSSCHPNPTVTNGDKTLSLEVTG
jgi:hypothetical protein